MTSKELNRLLIKSIPEIEKNFIEETSWQEGIDTGSHIIFGDVLKPFLISSITKNDTEMLLKIANMLEEILEYNDEYSENVIAISLFEGLSFECDVEIFGKLLKKKTKKLFAIWAYS
jgi:hypothetical protein